MAYDNGAATCQGCRQRNVDIDDGLPTQGFAGVEQMAKLLSTHWSTAARQESEFDPKAGSKVGRKADAIMRVPPSSYQNNTVCPMARQTVG